MCIRDRLPALLVELGQAAAAAGQNWQTWSAADPDAVNSGQEFTIGSAFSDYIEAEMCIRDRSKRTSLTAAGHYL